MAIASSVYASRQSRASVRHATITLPTYGRTRREFVREKGQEMGKQRRWPHHCLLDELVDFVM